MNKFKLFLYQITRFKPDGLGALFYGRTHFERIIPNLKHFLKTGYISYTISLPHEKK